jgi:antitoxin ParD1/3/4
MRTNIDIDDDLLAAAMRAGPFNTKKDAVEAGLRLLARQAAYRDILALRGKLRWEDAPRASAAMMVDEPPPPTFVTKRVFSRTGRRK